jgi:hypothetical protein
MNGALEVPIAEHVVNILESRATGWDCRARCPKYMSKSIARMRILPQRLRSASFRADRPRSSVEAHSTRTSSVNDHDVVITTA